MANPAPGFVKHPDYEVKIEPLDAHMQVKVGDTVIADSRRAVSVLETRHRPVWYMPLDDVHADLISATQTDTFCPFKGHASYWSVTVDGATVEDAIWAYLEPYDECADIQAFASFYTNKVDLYIDGELMNKDGPGWTD